MDGLTYTFQFREEGEFVELTSDSGYAMKRFVDLNITCLFFREGVKIQH